jgi:hypothetical protein
MTDPEKMKIQFAPGAFDDFDGTQEELDELVNEIHRLAESGELFKNSRQVEIEDLSPEDQERLLQHLLDDDSSERNLQ